VAGCASGPKNIKDSLQEAQAAASSATAQLDPRVLQPQGADGQEGAKADKSMQASPNDLRQQLEQLLHALVNR
jgi:heterodisulfide reductase subunit A-like polyferredoxin